jgi:hypothetical protein
MPQLITDLLQLLLGLSVPAAICSMLFAGLALRQEGGATFEMGGKFQRWIVWTVILLTLPQILSWFAAYGLQTTQPSGIATPWLNTMAAAFGDFVQQIVVMRLLPIAAAFFVLKAVLDAAQGGSPIESVIAAIFLLSAASTVTLMQSWNDGSQFATTSMLSSAWNFLAGTILPEAAGLAVVGAVVNFARNRPVGAMVASALGFLSVSALWRLLQVMVSG